MVRINSVSYSEMEKRNSHAPVQTDRHTIRMAKYAFEFNRKLLRRWKIALRSFGLTLNLF